MTSVHQRKGHIMNCIHHIDGNLSNNAPDNLMLVNARNPHQMTPVTSNSELIAAQERLSAARAFWLLIMRSEEDGSLELGDLTEDEQAQLIRNAAEHYQKAKSDFRKLVLNIAA